ncbi:MAG: hypothetical protein L3J47_00075 [Sulfurovum sp.]|nr:hypothetical protein [Sulfurovum sp.]
MSFMVADAPIALKHLRSTDTHAPMLFKGTKNGGKQIWKITRQKESTPLGWRMAVD